MPNFTDYFYTFGRNEEAKFFRAVVGQNLEIQAKFFRLYFNFQPQRSAEIFFGQNALSLST